jgi:hypothetical protein
MFFAKTTPGKLVEASFLPLVITSAIVTNSYPVLQAPVKIAFEAVVDPTIQLAIGTVDTVAEVIMWIPYTVCFSG